VTSGPESAGSYLHEKDYENLATDLTTLVRRYSLQALVAGVGLGYVLARSTASRPLARDRDGKQRTGPG
jgi:hypothetical protein